MLYCPNVGILGGGFGYLFSHQPVVSLSAIITFGNGIDMGLTSQFGNLGAINPG
jgi:hypothetical protein